MKKALRRCRGAMRENEGYLSLTVHPRACLRLLSLKSPIQPVLLLCHLPPDAASRQQPA